MRLSILQAVYFEWYINVRILSAKKEIFYETTKKIVKIYAK